MASLDSKDLYRITPKSIEEQAKDMSFSNNETRCDTEMVVDKNGVARNDEAGNVDSRFSALEPSSVELLQHGSTTIEDISLIRESDLKTNEKMRIITTVGQNRKKRSFEQFPLAVPEDIMMIVPKEDKKYIINSTLQVTGSSSYQHNGDFVSEILSDLPKIKWKLPIHTIADSTTGMQIKHSNFAYFSEQDKMPHLNSLNVGSKGTLNNDEKCCIGTHGNASHDELSLPIVNLGSNNDSDSVASVCYQTSEESLVEDGSKRTSYTQLLTNELSYDAKDTICNERYNSSEAVGSLNSPNLPSPPNFFCNRSPSRRGGRSRKRRTKYDAAYQEMESLGEFDEIVKQVDLSKIDFGSAAGEVLRWPERYSYDCWREGFTIRLGADGRRLLLRKLRAIYATDPNYWQNVLKLNDLDIKNLFTVATVPQIFKITYLMGKETWGFALKCACFTSSCYALLQNDLELDSECSDEFLGVQEYARRVELHKRKVEEYHEDLILSFDQSNNHQNLNQEKSQLQQTGSESFLHEINHDNRYKKRLQKAINRLKTKQLLDTTHLQKTKDCSKNNEELNCFTSRQHVPIAGTEIKLEKSDASVFNNSYKNSNKSKANKVVLMNKGKRMNDYSAQSLGGVESFDNFLHPSTPASSFHSFLNPLNSKDDLDLRNLTPPTTPSAASSSSVSSNISDVFQRSMEKISSVEKQLTIKGLRADLPESLSNNLCGEQRFPIYNKTMQENISDELFRMLATPVPEGLLLTSACDKIDLNRETNSNKEVSMLEEENTDLIEKCIKEITSGKNKKIKHSKQLPEYMSSGVPHGIEEKELEVLTAQYSITAQYLQALSLFIIQQKLINCLKESSAVISTGDCPQTDSCRSSETTVGCKFDSGEDGTEEINISNWNKDVKRMLKTQRTLAMISLSLAERFAIL